MIKIKSGTLQLKGGTLQSSEKSPPAPTISAASQKNHKYTINIVHAGDPGTQITRLREDYNGVDLQVNVNGGYLVYHGDLSVGDTSLTLEGTDLWVKYESSGQSLDSFSCAGQNHAASETFRSHLKVAFAHEPAFINCTLTWVDD